MSLSEISINGYRSVHALRFPVRRLSVLVGANGVGKTNLYRAIRLLHLAATGELAEELAREGGLGAVFWAGHLKQNERHKLQIEAKLEIPGFEDGDDFSPRYSIDIGFPDKVSEAAFDEEAQIRSEKLWLRMGGRDVVLMERKGPSVWARDGKGVRILAEDGLLSSETALSRLRTGYPEIDAVRAVLTGWRFYHGFRTDAGSALRQPGLAVTSPMLSQDAGNLAGVFATLRHIRGDTTDLNATIADAFPGAVLDVPMPQTHASFAVRFPDLPHRLFTAQELSDGTLHFLALTGALLSYRLPPFIALNEPETSLHPDLLPALARLISKAAQRSQVWVVTHSRLLADALAEETGALPRTVIRKDGGTWLEGLNLIGTFADE